MSRRVCIISWDVGLETASGEGQAAIYMRDALQFAGVDVDLWAVYTGRQMPAEDSLSMKYDRLTVGQAVDYIKDYDYVHFGSIPLRPDIRSKPHLEIMRAARSFGVIIHDEGCIDERYDDFLDEMLELDGFRIIQFITPEIRERFVDFFDFYRHPEEIILPCYPPTLAVRENLPKDRKLVTACRMAPRKKILYLARIIDRLSVPVELWGAPPQAFYEMTLEEQKGYLDNYKGPFKIHPSISAKFTWAIFLINRGNDCLSIPRVELSALEAMSYGSLPIFSLEGTPGWLTGIYPGVLKLVDGGFISVSTPAERKAAMLEKVLADLDQMDPIETCRDIIEMVYMKTDYYEQLNKLVEAI